ncbi:MAG: hypothetical protein ABI810_21975 [Sphingomonas bacterium]
MRYHRMFSVGVAMTALDFASGAASARWNATNDEANRQRMMAEMPASDAADELAQGDPGAIDALKLPDLAAIAG